MPVSPLTMTTANSPTSMAPSMMRERAYISGSDPGLSGSDPTVMRHTLRDVLVAVAIFVFLVAVFYAVDRWLEWDTERRFEDMLEVVQTAATDLRDRIYRRIKKLITAIRRDSPAPAGGLECGNSPPVEED